MNIYITDMTREHICQTVEIEKASFSLPWSANAFEESLAYDHTVFLVAVLENTDRIVGYIGMYKVFNEGDITNVAVLPEYRGMGIGTMLMKAVMDRALKMDIQDITLEVRESNTTAIELYKKMGFKSAGIRKNFYEKPVENAMVMWWHLLPL